MTSDFTYTDIRSAGIRLTAEESEQIARAALAVALDFRGHSLHDAGLLHAVELAAAALPAPVRRALIAFRDRSNAGGCLLLTGLPVGTLPATPDRPESEPTWSEVPVATISQLMVMSMLGRSISYSDEKDGRLVQDVCPKRGAEQRQENSGSVLLELHTEDGFHPNPPHFLSLVCLRADHDQVAATVSGGIGDALPLLDAETVAALRRPEFRTRFSSSFVPDASVGVLTAPMPVLSGEEDCPDLMVDFHATVATTPRARTALERLEEAVRRTLKGLVLRPGDLIILDNRRAVHGRTDFTPRYDGNDRWLRRSFVVTDLRPLNGHLGQGGQGRSHRPVTPVAAGAERVLVGTAGV
ncbi:MULTISPECIES: TauD/TfdA family dioxygenase [Streptomycetaceae]|uniref:TauD/TfdA family dioxygenase n=1 Tax=Streptomycetaceae TaxID=2062 RepID=UPI0006713DD0|nr:MULTISPECIES: TauD/TfdA family dioxygenase [Streptomycetaceae]